MLRPILHYHERSKEVYAMTESEAKAKVGKRVRTCDGSHDVPPGTTGTVIGALPVGAVAATASGCEGKYPDPTAIDASWMGLIEFDDALKNTSLFEEWDESLEEI